jgi:hypothetical protein
MSCGSMLRTPCSEVDREEDAERHDEELRPLVDTEPHDHQWNERQMRHVADHLHARVGDREREARQAVQEAERQADASADHEPRESPAH